jgi:hypothetical protein
MMNRMFGLSDREDFATVGSLSTGVARPRAADRGHRISRPAACALDVSAQMLDKFEICT